MEQQVTQVSATNTNNKDQTNDSELDSKNQPSIEIEHMDTTNCGTITLELQNTNQKQVEQENNDEDNTPVQDIEKEQKDKDLPKIFFQHVKGFFQGRPGSANKAAIEQKKSLHLQPERQNSLIIQKTSGNQKQQNENQEPALKRMRSRSVDNNKDGHNKNKGDNGDMASPSSASSSEFTKQFEKVDNFKEQYLILMVHGIGTKEEWQVYNSTAFKESMSKVCGIYYKNSKYEFVVKMVDWKSLLNNKQTKEKIQRVTVKEGADSYRELFNETVVDILFYLSKQYRLSILMRVAEEGRKFYNELWQEGKNPRFKGKVSLVAHSLGTVISYDLLMRQWPPHGIKPRKTQHMFDFKEEGNKENVEEEEEKDVPDRSQSIFSAIIDDMEQQNAMDDQTLQLGFNIEHFFLLGSPLGIFVSIYNEENFVRQKLPTTKSFYNIFHPSDLIAYRVEPLFQSMHEIAGVNEEIRPAVKVPYYKNNGYRTYNSVSNFFKKNPNNIIHSYFQQINEVKQQFKDIENEKLIKQSNVLGYGSTMDKQAEDLEEEDDFAEGDQRYDFVLQEKGLESIIKPIGLIQSHNKYFNSKDVAYFILRKIHKEKIPYYL